MSNPELGFQANNSNFQRDLPNFFAKLAQVPHQLKHDDVANQVF